MISILWTSRYRHQALWGAAGMTLFGGLVIRKIVDIDV